MRALLGGVLYAAVACLGCTSVLGLGDLEFRDDAGAPASSSVASGGGGTGAGAGGSAGDSSSSSSGAGGCLPAAYRASVVADVGQGGAYWRLGEATGTMAVTEVGSIVGTYEMGVSLGVPGALVCDNDTAIHFAAASPSYVDMGNVAALDFPGQQAFSVEFWAKPDAPAPSEPHVVVSKSNGTEGWALRFEDPGSGGTIALRRIQAGPADEAYAALPADGTYHHVAATYDGTTITMYVDGVADDTPVSSSKLLQPTQVPFVVGATNGGSGYPFVGDVDEVAVYDFALTDAQVAAHYHAAGH